MIKTYTIHTQTHTHTHTLISMIRIFTQQQEQHT